MKASRSVPLIILMSLSFFINEKLSAQGLVKGLITEADGKPAVSATVGIQNTNRITISDQKGHFELKLQPGKQVLYCSMVGYDMVKVEINITGSDTIIQNFTLIKSGHQQLNEVTVSGTSKKRKIETSGFAVNVIETKEASLRNVQTNELLDRTVGVRVRQNGGLGSNVEYNLNGMSGRSVGIFIDGIDISTYGSSFSLNNIPPSMIERIEVYKGVLPSYLSGDYMGGAINVILKKVFNQNNIAASVSYGSFNTFQADASAIYRNSKNGFTAKGSGFYTYTDNSYETWGKFSKYVAYNGVVTRNYRAKRFNDAYKALGGRFEIGFTNVKWADAFLFGYNGSDTYKEIPHGQTMGRPYVGRFNEAQANVFSLSYAKKNLFITDLDLSFNGVYSDRDTYLQDTVGWVYNWDGNYRLDINQKPMYRAGEGQQADKLITNINRKISTFRTNLGYDIFSGHRISLNHVFYTIDRNDEDLLRPVNNQFLKTKSDLRKNVLALNYEAQTFKDKLKSNLFVKYYQQAVGRSIPTVTVVNGENKITIEKADRKVNATGYGLALSYTLAPGYILIGSAEKAVRMPDESEILGNPTENVLSNFSIRPEMSNNLNLGFRLGSFDFRKHKMIISGNAFLRNVKDRIIRQVNTNLVDSEVEVSPFVNLGKAQSIGFEGELGYIYDDRLNIMFNFSRFRSLYKGTGSAADRLSQYYNTQVPNEPFFTLNGNIQYRINNIIQKKSVLNLFYNFGYIAPFNTIWPESEWFTTPAQFVNDLGVSYRFPDRKLVISIDAKNLFNAEVYDNFGVQKPGAAFYVKLNYSIDKF